MNTANPVLSTTEPVIWSSVVRSLLLPLRERHIDTTLLLRQCGISEMELEHPHTPIPLRKYLLFMETAALEADDPLLGVRLARATGPEILDALGFLFLSSPTLYDALHSLSHYLTLLQDATRMRASQEGNELWFHYELYGVEASENRQDTEFSLALTTRLIRMFGGSEIDISGIQFRHGPSVPVRNYELLLGTRCTFNQDSNAVRIPGEYARMGGKLFEPHLVQILKDYLDADLEKKQRLATFADQIRQIINDRHVLPPITAQKIANHLGVSTATLNRRLRAEKLSFKELVDDIHFNMAKRFLLDSTLSITQISQAVGFSGVASFSRAFRRWSDGVTPRQFRTKKFIPHGKKQ